MELREELMPPTLDPAKVARLSRLAAEIDGGRIKDCANKLAAFNAEAEVNLSFDMFQGIYGGQDHATWVRSILSKPWVRHIPDITSEELAELVERVSSASGTEAEINFWVALLEANLPGSRICNLIFWPGEYFGDGNNRRELTPQQIVEIALSNPRSNGTTLPGPTADSGQ